MKKLFKFYFLLFFLFSAPGFAAEPGANKIKTNTSAFNNNLGAGDNTVQKALDTMDNTSIVGGEGINEQISYFTGTGTIAGNAKMIFNTTTNLTTLYNLTLSVPLADASVADTVTLTNITQITARSHIQLSDIGTNTHSTIDTHLAAANPHTDSLNKTLNSANIYVGNATNVATGVAMSGDVAINNTGVTTIQSDSVALTTDTTGNYAAGDAEAGAALTGDNATGFFTLGNIEIARGGTGAGNFDDLIALGTNTTGNYVATVADSGAAEITVSGSGSETAAVTLAIASAITRDTEWDTWAEHPALLSTQILIGNATNVTTVVSMSGDGSISNAGVLAINDDSHAHTTTTISGVDISADTNLAVTAPVVLTDDTLSLTIAKDLVTTAPLTGGTDDILPGADADITLAITVAKDIVAGGGLSGGEDNVLPGADADTTLTLDLTEINSLTWGSGTFTTMTFDAGVTDPVFTFGSNSIAITNAATFTKGGNAVLDSAYNFAGDVTGTSGATIVGDDSHAHTSPTLPATVYYLGTAITESEMSFSNITTLNANTTQHGFMPYLNNNASTFMDGTGAWTAPSAGANTALSNLASVAINTALISDANLTDNFGSSAAYWATSYIDTGLFNSGVGAGVSGLTVTYASQYPTTHNTTFVKATSALSSNYSSFFATDPAKSLTGSQTDNQWIATGATNNRFHIDLGSGKTIKRIYYENYHDSGTSYGGRGARNFTFWGSNTAGSFTELTYGTDTGWTQLTTNATEFNIHAESDTSSPQYITVTNTVAYQYYAVKIADDWGGGYIGLRRIELQTGATPMLELLSPDNNAAAVVKINAAQASVTTADTFIDFRSTTGSEGTIAGTGSAGVLAYNTFTGSHYTQVINKAGLKLNMLLEIVDEDILATDWNNEQIRYLSKENFRDINGTKLKDAEGNALFQDVERIKIVKHEASPKPQLFKTRICQTKGSPAAIGVYGGTDKENRDLVLSLGTGFMWVANKGKGINVGDLLVSSDLPGCAELQDDGIIRNISVAKATGSIIWQDGETKRLIKVIYLGG